MITLFSRIISGLNGQESSKRFIALTSMLLIFLIVCSFGVCMVCTAFEVADIKAISIAFNTMLLILLGLALFILILLGLATFQDIKAFEHDLITHGKDKEQQ